MPNDLAMDFGLMFAPVLLWALNWYGVPFVVPPAVWPLQYATVLLPSFVAMLAIRLARPTPVLRIAAGVMTMVCLVRAVATFGDEWYRLRPAVLSAAGFQAGVDTLLYWMSWQIVLGSVTTVALAATVIFSELSSHLGNPPRWMVIGARWDPEWVREAMLVLLPVTLWPVTVALAPDQVPWDFRPLAHVLSPVPAIAAALIIRGLRPTSAARMVVWGCAVFSVIWGAWTIWAEWQRLHLFLAIAPTIEMRANTLMTMISWQVAGGGFAMVILGILTFRADRHLGAAQPRRARSFTPVTGAYRSPGSPGSSDALATARLAERRDTLPLLRSQRGLVLGEWRGNRPDMRQAPLLRWEGVGSLLTFAPPGKGKGVSVIGPALLTYDGPIVCFDPKGENAATWAYSRLKLGHKVAVLDPFDIPAVTAKPARFNPLDLVHDGRHFLADVRVITDAIVVHDPTDKGHFYDLAKKIIGAVVAFVCAVHEGRYRTLTAVYALLQGSMREFDEWAEWIVQYPEFADGVPSAGAGLWLQVSEEERGSFYSTLTRHVDFLMDRNIQEALSESTFDLATLLEGDLDLFICLPDWAKTDYSRFVRLFVTLAVNTVMRADRRPRKEVLFLLDELSVMGRLNAILNPEDGGGALTVGRAAGIKVWGIIQNPANLALCYGENGLKTWKGSCSVLQVFGVAKGDLAHSEEISKLVGETVIEVESTHEGSGSQRQAGHLFGGTSANTGVAVQQQRRWILTPDEIRRLPAARQVLFADDIEHPMLCHRAVYHEREEWRYRYGVNPFVDALQPHAVPPEQQALEYPNDLDPPKPKP